MDSLDAIIEACFQQAKTAPGLVSVYAEMWAKKTPYTKEEIEDGLLIKLEAHRIQTDAPVGTKPPSVQAKQEPKSSVKKIVKKPLVHVDASVSVPKLSGLDWGLSRKKHERKMATMTQIRSLILSKEGQGLTKTGILKRIRKDNSYWRATITEWIEELVSAGSIMRVKNRYYSPQVVLEPRERMLHRLVFESLEDGPLSTTAIARRVGCDGGNQRAVLRKTVEDLSSEGYIRLEGIRWRWVR